MDIQMRTIPKFDELVETALVRFRCSNMPFSKEAGSIADLLEILGQNPVIGRKLQVCLPAA